MCSLSTYQQSDFQFILVAKVLRFVQYIFNYVVLHYFGFLRHICFLIIIFFCFNPRTVNLQEICRRHMSPAFLIYRIIDTSTPLFLFSTHIRSHSFNELPIKNFCEVLGQLSKVEMIGGTR